MHSGQSKLAVRFYDNTLQLARADELQWDGQYQRYTVSSDCILSWSIFDHATGRCYNGEDLGNLPDFIQGKVPAQPGDSLEVLVLDAALAARH